MGYTHTGSTTRTVAGQTGTSTSVTTLGNDPVKSTKASGAVVNIGGKLFRKATAYSVRSYSVQPGRSQNSTFKIKSGSTIFPGSITSTPGGPSPGYVNLSVFNGYYNSPNTGFQNLTSMPFIPQSMQNEAVTKALLDLVGDSAQLGEDFATFGQTIRLLANPTVILARELKRMWEIKEFNRYLRQSVSMIRNSNPLTGTAQRYLEYVYGWRPLMQEIHTIVQLGKGQAQKPLLVHGRGTSSRYESKAPTSYDAGFNATKTTVQVNTKAVTRCNIWAMVDPNNAGIRSLNQLGLANPSALAWELMSWSFVIDWVLPIGAVLNALTATKGLTFLDGSVANRVKVSGLYEQFRNFDQGDSDGSHVAAGGKFRYDGYTRSRLTSFPKPGLWLDHDPLRGDRPLKAAALTVLALGSLR